MTLDLIRFDSPPTVDDWSAIDDRVMGGVSASRLRYDVSGHAIFEGEVSLESGGGFASVRSRPMDLAAAGAKAYVLDVLGDGKRYKLNVRTDDGFDGLNYQASFNPPAGAWSVIRLPIADFRATFRGRNVPGAPPLDPASVRQIGFVIADKQAGAFSLAVQSIRAE
jgi:NADH dehydrogenase [ubiquinone] 1 alpha subcomplex assembly factor 1